MLQSHKKCSKNLKTFAKIADKKNDESPAGQALHYHKTWPLYNM